MHDVRLSPAQPIRSCVGVRDCLAECPQLFFGRNVAELAWLFGALLIELPVDASDFACSQPYRRLRALGDAAGGLLFELALDVGGQVAVQVRVRDQAGRLRIDGPAGPGEPTR